MAKGRRRTDTHGPRSKPRRDTSIEKLVPRSTGVDSIAQEPEIDYGNTKLVDQIRESLGLEAAALVERSPSIIRGYADISTRRHPVVVNALGLWASRGKIDRHLDLGYLYPHSTRMDVASGIALRQIENREDWDDQRRVGRFGLSALTNVARTVSFERAYGRVDLHKIDVVGYPEVSEMLTERIKASDFHEEAQKALSDRVRPDIGRTEYDRLKTLLGSVTSAWTSRDGVYKAQRYQAELRVANPDDYRIGIQAIDWQVVIHEERVRGGLPKDALKLMTDSVMAASQEFGLEYAAHNSISGRTEPGYQLPFTNQ